MKISILSPVFNEEKHIEEMIESVRAQDHEDWEICFVDDGSTDATVAKIEAAAAADGRVRLVAHGEKLGKAAAFNRAYAAATGDVVTILSGDDRLPAGALAIRAADMATCRPGERGMATYKLRSFSEDPAFDAMVLPRGDATSMSGGSLTLSRELAEAIFPIPESLPSEDIWLGCAGPALSRRHIQNPIVTWDYRIHGGNSNPRHRGFEAMSASIAPRHEAWRLLLDQDRFELPAADRATLEARYAAEQHRRRGDVVGILRTRGLPLVDRLGFAGMADPRLWALRRRFYKVLSGRQGR
ncbi:MAG: glycosyltransferase family 2 protein [Austwickia sp.]|jgi:glycosyltransferase involved in cell wall biosynthesis|nr:MAG: glycosyltransferase family 2 protein [Austwickia sp.]